MKAAPVINKKVIKPKNIKNPQEKYIKSLAFITLQKANKIDPIVKSREKASIIAYKI